MKALITKYTLQNAVRYGGKAQVGAVIGKVLSEKPDLHGPALAKEVQTVVAEVNRLSPEEQRARLENLAPDLLEKKKVEKKQLPDLKNVKEKVVMRFEPSPSGALHIGHAIPLLLNSEYCKRYKGTLILRISDTNPGNIDPSAYTLIEEDARWVTGNTVTKVVIQSDRLDMYYARAHALLHAGQAYVCTCAPEHFSALVQKQEACPCRHLHVREQLERWTKMLTSYDEGEAVVRIKTDLHHKNPAIRDWPALRINLSEHPRVGNKYRVWPLMNFSVAVDDYEFGLTHVLRGKDHLTNTERQAWIFRYFQWTLPEYIHTGKVNFKGLKLSASGVRAQIEKGKFSGWDDIRLPFLAAFRRRGIAPEALARNVTEIGCSLADKTVEYEEFMKSIYAYDRETIDKATDRYFFIEKPKKIAIKKAPTLTAQAPLHPDNPSRGTRALKTEGKFYVEDTLQAGKVYRFMHLFNFKDKAFLSEGLDPSLGAKLIHWLPVMDGLVQVKVLMSDGKYKTGLGEPGLKKIKKGTVVQFERKFFCRYDHRDNDTLVFWYMHT